MREAQKMMQDPAFQEYVKKMTESKQFQASIQKTKEVFKDPKKAQELEKQVQQQVAEGQKALEAAEKARAEAETKPAAKKEEEEEEEIEDVPNLNLN